MKSKDQKLLDILNELRLLGVESEVVEFKEAKSNFDFRKLGKYFSALSNEANLKNQEQAWLIFGVRDSDKGIVGTSYRSDHTKLHNLKSEIARDTNGGETFIEIHEIILGEGRVLMFEIPPAPQGIPISFKGHYYGRTDEDLGALSPGEYDRIRSQNKLHDWTAQVLPDATIEDLDPDAITFARAQFKKKFKNKSDEVDNWDDITFLNKARLTRRGKITRGTIILLGLAESEELLYPTECKIRWILRNEKGDQLDYELMTCPMILAVDQVYAQIRNLKYRYLKRDGTLFPDEVQQYEPYIIRESINNCIAHQDYTLSGRINVIENHDALVFTNKGSFIPKSVEEVVITNAPEEQYRNPFLATAMFNIGMVDTAGGGIRKMYDIQAGKYFPLPEYNFENQTVSLLISGKVLDMEYASILARDKDLTLEEIILLDKVQKKKALTENEIIWLRKKKLVEGHKTNLRLSLKVAQHTGQKARYTKARAFDNKYYKDLIIEAIKQHGSMTRQEIDELLWDKLGSTLNENHMNRIKPKN